MEVTGLHSFPNCKVSFNPLRLFDTVDNDHHVADKDMCVGFLIIGF
jgi:hypothetical protein